MTDDPLLDYRLATNPNPLQAGGVTGSRNHITIAVFAPAGQPVYCDEIRLAVPKSDGDGTPGFAEQPEWSCDNAEWETSATFLDEAASGPRYFRATFTPTRGANQLIDYPLNFGITGPLGSATGNLVALLQEHTGSGDKPVHLSKRIGSFTMTVDSQALYLNNFFARDLERPTVPRSKFSAADHIDLVWESNGTRFQLYDGDGTVLYDGDGTKIKDANGTHFTLPRGSVVNDTTFTLCATLTSGDAQSRNGFEPIYQYASVTVTITDPTLTALTVTGGTQLERDLTVTGGTRLQQDLTVAGGTQLQRDLTVSGGTQLQRDLTVSGGTTMQSGFVADYSGRQIGVLGYNGLHISGNCTISDDVSVGGDLDVDQALRRAGNDVVCYKETFALGSVRYEGYQPRWAFGNYDCTISLDNWDDVSSEKKPGFNWQIDHP